MGITYTCDGCDDPCAQDTVKERGRLATVFYCATCSELYDAARATIEAERVKMVEAFAEFRAQALSKARGRLKRLPDE